MSKPAHPIQESPSPRKRFYTDPHHELKSGIAGNEMMSSKHEKVHRIKHCSACSNEQIQQSGQNMLPVR